MDLGTTTWIVTAGIVAGVGGTVFLFLRSRPAKEDYFLFFRCPGCKSRLRYGPRQVGHKGMCSNCKERFLFPALFELASSVELEYEAFAEKRQSCSNMAKWKLPGMLRPVILIARGVPIAAYTCHVDIVSHTRLAADLYELGLRIIRG
jgi:hypothetical protein